MGIQAVQTLCKGTRTFVSAALLRHAVPDKLVQNSQLKSEVNSSSYLKSVNTFPNAQHYSAVEISYSAGTEGTLRMETVSPLKQ